MNKEIATLIKTVQHNCHIADARHAGDYTLCIYLLKMREFYRWEQGYDHQQLLTTDDVGDWLVEREGLWDDLEELDFKPLHIDGNVYDPFDNKAINAALLDKKLVYSAGLGNQCRPHFYIAVLDRQIQKSEYSVLVSSKEYARDMASPPAMAQGNTIYIRNESLRQMLWERVEEWRMNGARDSPLGRSIAYYDFDNEAVSALDNMAETETRMVIEHEIGEVMAGKVLGDTWLKMLNILPRSTAEIMLRAIRDHYADAINTLPELMRINNPASIHFYFGNMTAMRKKIAPKILDAYEVWRESSDLSVLEKLVPIAESHWLGLAQKSLKLYAEQGKEATDDIELLVEANIF